MVFIGAVLWSLNAPMVKYLTIGSLLICGLRSVIAGIALAGFIRPKKLHWNAWMLVYVCCYSMVCLAVIASLAMTSAPIAVGMQYTSVMWLFLADLVRTRKFVMRKFIPVFIIAVGVVLFMMSGTDQTSSLGNLIAFSSGITFALMTVSAKKAAGTNPVGLVSVANFFTGAAVFLLFPWCLKEIPDMTPVQWLIMLILGAVQIGGGYAFYNMGVQKVAPQKAAIIALAEMILGPVWVALFLKEYPSVIVLTGFIFILTGMILDAKMNPAEA